MTKLSSTMLSVGTLLRRAEDTGATVRVLVHGTWLDGRVLGCDGLGAVLDDGAGQQALVRLDQVAAVTFSRAQIDDGADEDPGAGARHHPPGRREPIEAGPVTPTVTVPAPSTGGFDFIPPRQR